MATAIRNRAHESGWDFATFIPLDDPPTAPKWLPRARLWVGLKRWGVDHAATVIESRVQEAGGTPKELTVADVADRAIREIRETTERNALLDSSEGVEIARREFKGLFEEVQRACAASAGLIVKLEHQNDMVSMDAAGIRRKVTFVFGLTVRNSLRGSALRLAEFDGSSERGRNWEHHYHFDFGPSGEYGWREGTQWGRGEFLTSARLVDRMAMRLIEETRGMQTNRSSTDFTTW